MRRVALAALIAFAATLWMPAAGRAEETVTFPQFRTEDIDKSLKVGYGVKLVDLNGDGKIDIVVADSARVIWFENPTWKLHTILQGVTKPDNVCIDAYDIDGDGKLDLVLGADWQPNNTKAGGTLQWLSRGTGLDDPWTVHPILDSLPTLHRAHFGKIEGKPAVIVGPLKGKDSTGAKNFLDSPALLLAFPFPKDPANGKWEPHVLTDSMHVMHNFLPLNGEQGMEVLTASYEGVNLIARDAKDQRTITHIGAGDQSHPGASRGSSEVKIGHFKDGSEFIATIEPFHGNQVAIYSPPSGVKGLTGAGAQDSTLWTRTVIEDKLEGGHGVWCADLDGDGNDEVIIGWRDGAHTGVNLYKHAPGASTPWAKYELDKGGIAAEDLAAADLNGDGKIDIVAVGRATHNVRIYWNEGSKGK